MIFIWVIILGLLQLTVLKDVNLLVVLAVFAGLRKGPFKGVLIGALIGMFVEVISVSGFGITLVLYSLVGFLSGIIKTGIYYKENIFMEFIFSFFGILIFYFTYFLLTNRGPTSIIYLALFSAIISPVVFRVVER